MISAPLRSTQTAQIQTKPSIKTHGHLALLEWNETVPAAPPAPFGPKRRSLADRCCDGGTLVLLAVTAGAALVSLAR